MPNQTDTLPLTTTPSTPLPGSTGLSSGPVPPPPPPWAARSPLAADVSDGVDPAVGEAVAAKAGFLDLSLTGILGGALASVSAAALGARLGVAGTLVGAAIGSLVSAVAGAVYTRSLQRTRALVFAAGRMASGDRAPSLRPSPLRAEPAARSGVRMLQRLDTRRIALAAFALFAAVLVVVTGIELATGRSLDGQQGTTVGHVTKVGSTGHGKSSGTTSPGTTPTSESTDAGTTSPTDSPTSPETGTSTDSPTSDPTTTDSPTSDPQTTDSPTTDPTPDGGSGTSTDPALDATTPPVGDGSTSPAPATTTVGSGTRAN